MTWPARHIAQSIAASPQAVYDFVGDPRNLPCWASGLSGADITQAGDHWEADSPMGRVEIRFAPANVFGVLDHDVTLPSGDVVHNPLRVLPNGNGAEVVFTLYRLPGVTDTAYEKDAATIEKDLRALKQLLEKT